MTSQEKRQYPIQSLFGILLAMAIGLSSLPIRAQDSFYYVLSGAKGNLPPVEQRIQLGFHLQPNGKIQHSLKTQPQAKSLERLLIGSGKTKPQDWNQENFVRNFQGSLLELREVYPRLTEIQLDFEFYPKSAAIPFQNLICRLQKPTNDQGIRLSLSLFPPNHPDNGGFHDWTRLPPCADRIYLMAYDQHNPRTKPGPITSQDWITENLRLIEALAGKTVFSKIVLGLPLYGYSWNASGKYHRTYPIRRIKATEEAGRDGVVWKRSANETVYIPSRSFLSHWESEARNNGFAGIAYWRWGFDSQSQ